MLQINMTLVEHLLSAHKHFQPEGQKHRQFCGHHVWMVLRRKEKEIVPWWQRILVLEILKECANREHGLLPSLPPSFERLHKTKWCGVRALKDNVFFLTQKFWRYIWKILTFKKWFFWKPGMVPDHMWRDLVYKHTNVGSKRGQSWLKSKNFRF